MNIYLSLDRNCLSESKIRNLKLGGTELFFIKLWAKELRRRKHKVETFPKYPSGEYDLCIHSNVFDHTVVAKRHILWAGSWHAQGIEHVDTVIVNSQYMKDKLGWEEAIVIPAPFDSDLLTYKDGMWTPRRIVSTSNPNRFINHAIEVCKHLDGKTYYDYYITGGNKLYSDNFNEPVQFFGRHPNIIYRGILNREDLIAVLTLGEIWIYPCFTNDSETLCVSCIEAAALEIPVFLPKRRPFTETLPQAFFSESPEEMANQIINHFENGEKRIKYDVSQYTEEVVFDKLNKIVTGHK